MTAQIMNFSKNAEAKRLAALIADSKQRATVSKNMGVVVPISFIEAVRQMRILQSRTFHDKGAEVMARALENEVDDYLSIPRTDGPKAG